MVHHWAHQADSDCDPWFEPETEWHRDWKALFPKECTEVVIGEHRADICIPNRGVIELQNSSISPLDIEARETHYGKRMIWIINGKPFRERFFVLERYAKSQSYKFRWKLCPSSWLAAQRPRYIDLGDTRAGELAGSTLSVSRAFPDTGARKQVRRDLVRAQLTQDVNLNGKILRIKTLHPTGWGSVEILDREHFLLMINGQEEALKPINK
jgi:hypothetical protein